MEQEHGDGVSEPMLFALFVDAARPIERRLDRSQDRRQECALAVKHAGHVPAERFHQRDDDRAIKNDLNPADEGHGMSLC